jgi:DNA-binding LytR/AlgR family response regulator
MTNDVRSTTSFGSLRAPDSGGLRRVALYGLGCLALPVVLIIYCESYSVILGYPPPGLAISGPWAIQVSLGWILAMVMLGIFGARLAQSAIASRRPRATFVTAIVSVAAFELVCEGTLQYFVTRDIGVLAFAFNRALPMVAGSTLLITAFVGARMLRSPGDANSRDRKNEEGDPHPARWTETIEVMTGTGRTLIHIEEIECLQADGNYISVMHASGRTYLLRQTMAAAERSLDPERFVRIHRSMIVNRHHTKERRSANILVLRSGRAVVIGRAYRGRVPIRMN